jgi:hypothetical protein
VRQAPVGAPRRTATVYEKKTAHPFWTALLVVNSVLMLFTAGICGVVFIHGHCDYDPVTKVGSLTRVIPPLMRDFGIYESFYNGSMFGTLPGNPQDPLPPGAPDAVHRAAGSPTGG